MFDKDRATHPIMGFRAPRLPKWNAPYLQIALDAPDLEKIKKVLEELPKSDKIILEAGTPLIKKYGVKVISELRQIAKDAFIIADLKTLDVGQLEVDMSFDETADAVVVSGLATVDVIDKFIYEAKRLGIYCSNRHHERRRPGKDAIFLKGTARDCHPAQERRLGKQAETSLRTDQQDKERIP